MMSVLCLHLGAPILTGQFASFVSACFSWGTAKATQRPSSCRCATCRESNIFRSYLWVSHPSSTTPTQTGRPHPLCLPACRWTTKGRCSSVWTRATRASRTWSSWWSFTSSTAGCCLANSNTTAPSSPCEPRANRDPSLDEHSLCICALSHTHTHLT